MLTLIYRGEYKKLLQAIFINEYLTKFAKYTVAER